MRRAALVAGAAACLVLAILATILAVDIWRWRDALAADDSRFRATPRASDWEPSARVPFAGTRSMLDIEDDVAFRKALRALRLADLDEPETSSTEVLLQRAEAQGRLEALIEDGGDPARRSRALSLLAVLLLSTPVADAEEQSAALKAASANLREAIALDPSNDEAKFNLEFILRQGRGGAAATASPAPAPSSNTGSSRGAATSPPGTGY